jgi:urocanate reductase
MARAYSPQLYWDLQNGLALASSANVGDGIRMGLAVGAALTGMGGTISYPAIRVGRAEGGTEIPGVWVNRYGQRFFNEATHYGYASRAVFEQEQHIVWAVFDETVKNMGG